MPFMDISFPERERFLKSMTGCHIPGYTGHCPSLKFQHGKGFGADTRLIIQKLRNRSQTFDMKPYREEDSKVKALKEVKKVKDEEPDFSIHTNLPQRPYILGYTGFIPGLNFRYGTSFTTAANESVLEFNTTQIRDRHRRAKDRFEVWNKTPQMMSVRNRDEVSRLVHSKDNPSSNTKASSITCELPPIAGYTGHIPRLIGSESSLSRRYHSAAKAGLALLREEKDRRRHIDLAKEAVRNAISCSHSL